MYFAASLGVDGKAQKHHYEDNSPFLVIDHEKKHLICIMSILGVGLEVIALYELRKDYEVAYFSLCFFHQHETR